MRTVGIGLLLAASVSGLAKDNPAVAAAKSACGPITAKFKVTTQNDTTPQPSLATDKALIYVVEDLVLPNRGCIGCKVTTRVGMDGAWMGATKGNSYLFFPVDPGEHHLCANWQSSLGLLSKYTSLASVTAESGKVYYFRAKVLTPSEEIRPSLSIEQVDPDEGKLLIASSKLSVPQKKN